VQDLGFRQVLIFGVQGFRQLEVYSLGLGYRVV